MSSSFESREELIADQFTADNIKQLLDHSAMVLYCVDATSLQEVTELKNLKFSNIIFNFPHYGGKSNLKLNRLLLKNFFDSAVNFIVPRGRISVSLCRGQGGTLADIPKRYDDTWKVVEMASYSGLILSSVLPFCVDNYPGYVSTGLRSQLKSFITAGGLTHEFTLFQGADVKHWGYPELSTIGEQIFLDSKRPLLHIIPWHPIFLIHQSLITVYSTSVNNVVDLTERNVDASVSKDFIKNLTGIYSCYAKYCDDSFEAFPLQHLVQHCNSSNSDTGVLHILTPSLELHLPEIINLYCSNEKSMCSVACERLHSSKKKEVHLFVGQVYRNCKISLDTCDQPIAHELMGVHDASQSNASSLAVEWIEKRLKDHMTLSRNNCYDHVNLKNVSQYCISKESKYIPLVTTGSYFHDDKHSQVFILHLDSLACAVFSIEDPRMLWSRDERFVDQFLHLRILEQTLFHNFSLYAPSYSHDICFWVPYTAPGIDEHTECRLTALVRRKCGETVISLTCINVWKPPIMPTEVCQELGTAEVISLCYRLVYSGISSGLSKPEAASMQSQLRLALMASDVKCKLR